jgi:predicted transcriptional regulator
LSVPNDLVILHMSKNLKDMITRAETWPEEAQEEAIAMLQAIEDEIAHPYELTEDDRKAIDRGLEDVRRGKIASNEDVSRLFARYRRP